jgi:hypothetical protein
MKRIQLQFTLINVVLFVALLAVSLSWWIDHRNLADSNRRQAMRALTQMHGNVTFDNDGNPIAVDFYPSFCSDADVANLRYLPTVRKVNLAYCFNISDLAVESLTYLPNLEVLYLYRNDPDFSNNFTGELMDLSLQPRLTDRALEYVSRIDSLQELYLWDNEFSDAGLLKLRSLKNLKKLAVRSSRISEDAVNKLVASLPTASIDAERLVGN